MIEQLKRFHVRKGLRDCCGVMELEMIFKQENRKESGFVKAEIFVERRTVTVFSFYLQRRISKIQD